MQNDSSVSSVKTGPSLRVLQRRVGLPYLMQALGRLRQERFASVRSDDHTIVVNGGR